MAATVMIIDLLKLSLADSVSVKDDAMRFESRTLVEVDQHLPDHGGQLSDDLLSVVLDSDCGCIAARMSIHTGYKLET